MSGLLLKATFLLPLLCSPSIATTNIRYTDTPAISRPLSYPYNYFFTVSKTEHCSVCLRHVSFGSSGQSRCACLQYVRKMVFGRSYEFLIGC